MSDLREGLQAIAEALGRGKGTFVLARTVATDGISNPFVLAVGSIRSVRINKGFMITIGLSREQLEALRTMCDETLAEQS